ncbi:DUF2849 domain-containing protein [Hyphococcus luteus]|uniref:DUF2849 domain-containing protein n=1 Tax=Hyphococcus luteus TaxID=2058213 RepID=A0A2S7K5S1_9PROT|nr:DUF2849 domain-containing protein [Marinicaulis flavus]PQA87853.1 DUF2849 domain-containing protein [Marinicaulis flavus]
MKAVTANRLEDGVVVYLSNDNDWTSDLTKAARFENDDAKAALAGAEARAGEHAGAYLIEVSDAGAPSGRETLRETIRKDGPTVRLDLGYQAEASS